MGPVGLSRKTNALLTGVRPQRFMPACVRFFAWLCVFWACYESWRAVLSAGRKCGGGSVCYFKELLWPRRSCSLLSSLFCDVFQVAGEGHHCRSPEFCPPLESFRRSIQGQNLSDSLTFCLQKCILKVSSQFVSDSIILWEAAAGISFSKFCEQTRRQLEFAVWDESVQKRIHCVCLWWAFWRTFFFFNIEIAYQDCLGDDCGQIAFNIPLWYDKREIWKCINMLLTPLIFKILIR